MYLPSLGRYVHADPCEKSLDAPLTYEVGWNKKLSYIFSFSRFGVTDVIHRYSRKFSSTVCLSRSLCTEKYLRERVAVYDQHCRNWYCQQLLLRQGNSNFTSGAAGCECPLSLDRMKQGSSAFTASYYTSLNLLPDLSFTEIVERKQCQLKDLRMLIYLQSTEISQAELQGRISGDKEWKQSRGEAGKQSEIGNDSTFIDVKGMQWLKQVCVTDSDRSAL